MKKSRQVFPEPFEEPTSLSNFKCFMSSYFNNNSKDDPELVDDRIEWAKFVKLPVGKDSKNEYSNLGFILGRPDGIQIWEIKKDNSLVQWFSRRGLAIQSAVLMREQDELWLIGGCGGKCVVLSLISGKIVSEIDMGGGVGEMVGGINGLISVIVAGVGVVLLRCCRDGQLVEIDRIKENVTSLVCDMDGLWIGIGNCNQGYVRIMSIIIANTNINNTHSLSLVAHLKLSSLLSNKALSSSPAMHMLSSNAAGQSTPLSSSPSSATIFPIPPSSASPSPSSSSPSLSSTSIGEIKLNSGAGTCLLLISLKDGKSIIVSRILPRSAGRVGIIQPIYWLSRGQLGSCGYHLSAISIAFDGRLICAASPKSTIHVWPLCGQGGPLSARLLCPSIPTNRLSRLQRSAGLHESQLLSSEPLILPSMAKLHPPTTSTLATSFIVPSILSQNNNNNDCTRSESLFLIQSYPPTLFNYKLTIQPQQPSRSLDDNNRVVITSNPLYNWQLPSITLNDTFLQSAQSPIPSKHQHPSSTTAPSSTNNNSAALLLTTIRNIAESSSTPTYWYTNIEVNSQIIFTNSCIRKLDKFTLRTYQTQSKDLLTEEPIGVLLEAVNYQYEVSPASCSSSSSRSDSSSIELQQTNTSPVKVPCPKSLSTATPSSNIISTNQQQHHQNQPIQICNSICGSLSYNDRPCGLYDTSLLHNAIFDRHENDGDGEQEEEEEDEEEQQHHQHHQISGVRLRRISGAYPSHLGHHGSSLLSLEESDFQHNHSDLDSDLDCNVEGFNNGIR